MRFSAWSYSENSKNLMNAVWENICFYIHFYCLFSDANLLFFTYFELFCACKLKTKRLQRLKTYLTVFGFEKVSFSVLVGKQVQ